MGPGPRRPVLGPGSALVGPIPVDLPVLEVDIWIMLAASATVALFVFTGRPIGRLVGALCGSVKHALSHKEAGVDFIISQGYEGGGHTGDVGSLVLWPEVIDAIYYGKGKIRPAVAAVSCRISTIAP